MENKKENNKKGKMTMERLARMMADGFEEISGKVATKEDLTEVKSKLAEHDKRFSKLEYKIDEVKDAVERLEESDILNLQKRVQVLEKAVRALAKQVS